MGPWGNPGGPRETLEDPQGPRCSPFAMPAHKIKPPGTQDGCHGCHGCPEVVSRTAARSPPPHAPGARMTVVTQTTSNNNAISMAIVWMGRQLSNEMEEADDVIEDFEDHEEKSEPDSTILEDITT